MVKKRILGNASHEYTTGCLLDYAQFKENYKLIAKDLCKLS